MDEFVRGLGSGKRGRMLRGTPGIEDRDLMHARDGAVWCAAFFREKLTADIVAGVGFERHGWISALLRAVVD